MKKVRKDSSKRVLRAGESQRKDGTYMYRWTDLNQNRQCVYAKSLNELRQLESQIAAEQSIGLCRSSLTVAEQVKMYLEVKANLKNSTYNNYQYYMKHCIQNSFLGRMKVIDVKKSHILKFYKDCSTELGYANGTIAILQKILHPAFQLAVDDNVIRNNPTQGCLKDYPVAKEVKYALSFEEEKELLARLQGQEYAPLMRFILYTGLRIGEALGLTWDDVNMQERTVSINHQLLYRPKDGKARYYCEDGTKNGKNRILPLSRQAYESLAEQRIFWMKCKKDAEFTVDGYKNFIFLSKSTGRPMNADRVRKRLQKIVAMNDRREVQLPNISPHILRHTFCTRLAEAGLEPKTIQHFMGHNDIRTTMAVYTHVNADREKVALEKLDDLQRTYAE